jgi:hypothetical protein
MPRSRSRKPKPAVLGRGKSARQRPGKVLPFRPRNTVECEDSVAPAALATWGPDHDRLPMRVTAIQWFDDDRHGKLKAAFTVYVPHWHVWISHCVLVDWGPQGERCILPDRPWVNWRGEMVYDAIFTFDSDREQQEFEEELLRSLRRARRDPPSPESPPRTRTIVREAGAVDDENNADGEDDDGVARDDHLADPDAPPF